jgi:hypothetical protein
MRIMMTTVNLLAKQVEILGERMVQLQQNMYRMHFMLAEINQLIPRTQPGKPSNILPFKAPEKHTPTTHNDGKAT